jgi:glycosyltransferase involved in cell wall biosynthesis
MTVMRKLKTTWTNRRPRRKPLDVCVVTRELYGYAPMSDAGASLIGIAQQIAATGDRVTLVWIPPDGRISDAERERLTAYYFERFLIKLEIIVECRHVLPIITGIGKQSAVIYYYLKENKFDAIYFGLEGGLGYYTILGRELGLFERGAQIYVIVHGPLVWQADADRFFLRDLHEVTVAHMERYCIEAGEFLLYTSEAGFDWIKNTKQWHVPARLQLLPSMRPRQWEGTSVEPPGSRRIDEIVLLAGADFHKGLTLFCDALDRLARTMPSRLKVTALGDFGRILGEHTGGLLVRRARKWPFEINLLPRLTEEEYLAYLQGRTRLAVIPAFASLTPMWVMTCLEEGIPFVATRVGAVPELIHPTSHERCLCEPQAAALAERIAAALAEPQAPARPAITLEAKRKAWRDHLDMVAETATAAGAKPRKRKPRKNLPLVSIVMVHHDRPHYVRQAIAAVEEQDYPNFELILVDDGSLLPESHALLDELEPEFKKRGWRILREENRYLGAARNAGVRVAKGERILFVDDDNALFPNAVSTFVHAMDSSAADICTAFQKVFYGPSIPPDDSIGSIQYFPAGGSLDLGLLLDSFGDANAMIRREVFDKIGYQIEDYGYTAQDWEFFLRAVLAGLKLRVIPEPLYWYRSSAEGMYRSSHWYSNRLPILEVFRKHGFAGLDHVYDLVLSTFVGDFEINGYRENLKFSISDERFLRLSKLEPNSDEAFELLAEIAAMEGRPDTALVLLGRMQRADYRNRVMDRLAPMAEGDKALADLTTGLSSEKVLSAAELREFVIGSLASRDPAPLSYVEVPDRLYLQASPGSVAFVVKGGGFPAGAMSVAATVSLDDALARPAEFLILAAPADVEPRLALRQATEQPADGSSGWCQVSHTHEPRVIAAWMSAPASRPHNLILAVRPISGSEEPNLGCFSAVTVKTVLGTKEARHPRLGPPPARLRAREWTRDEIKSVKLVTNRRSVLPLLLIPPNNEGIFLRPSAEGNVVATLPWGFPPFARKVIGRVEIAHEEASPFEFAMALTRATEAVEWDGERPKQHQAFSGWLRVEEAFRLHELTMEVREPIRTHLAINLAIRLPAGSVPSPAEAYWRQLILAWEV